MDWEIVALDALGLMLFFVPGVIAFIVDFSTGAIYLPPCGHSGLEPTPAGTESWRMITVPPDELDSRGISAAVTRETGQSVDLTSGNIQTAPLESIESFEQERQALYSAPH
jgi:hypothetical protein